MSEVKSLTGLFLHNTIDSMMRLSRQEDAEEFHKIYVDTRIQNSLDNILKLMKEKETERAESNNKFGNMWKKVKEERWAYQCMLSLEMIEEYLRSDELEYISASYCEDVRNAISKWTYDDLTYKFKLATIKSMKNMKRYKKLSNKQINMLIDTFIVPYFEEYPEFYQNYVEWMQDINHFFVYREKKKICKFPYTTEQYASIEECVKRYDTSGEYSSQDFRDYLKELICKMESISESHMILERGGPMAETESADDEEEDEMVRRDISQFYRELFCYPESTIGMVTEEIDNMLLTVANESYANYMFVHRIRKKTWEECRNSKGFMALMQYRLYRYLSMLKKENAFINSLIEKMKLEMRERYHIHISDDSVIQEGVWIDEECFLNHCMISRGAVLAKGVILDANYVTVEKNVFVDHDTKIIGTVEVKITGPVLSGI